jgi:hypothetical protein
MSAGAIGAIGATGVVATAGLVAAGLGVEFKRRKPLATIKIDDSVTILEPMKFTEWLRGGIRQGQPVEFKKLLRGGLPGGNSTTWGFKSTDEYDTWHADRYKTNESAAQNEQVKKQQAAERRAEKFTLNTTPKENEL